MATFNKFNAFVQDIGRKVHQLNSDTLNILLTNTLPTAADATYDSATTHTLNSSGAAEISAGNGYSAGGGAIASNAYSQTSGTAKLTGNAVTITASGGTIGPFRYAVLYNANAGTAAARPLIGWFDYGSSITLNDGELIKIGKDTSGNNWDSTTPLISVT